MVEFTQEFQCFFVRLPFKLYFRLRPESQTQYEIDQNSLRCSETKKCSQRFEIDRFCPGRISSLEPSKIGCESNRGTLRFTISISDILMTPSCSLRSFRNRRLVRCEPQVDTGFEIYGSSIGVCNLVCNGTQFK